VLLSDVEGAGAGDTPKTSSEGENQPSVSGAAHLLPRRDVGEIHHGAGDPRGPEQPAALDPDALVDRRTRQPGAG